MNLLIIIYSKSAHPAISFTTKINYLLIPNPLTNYIFHLLSRSINFDLLTLSIDKPKASIVWFYNTDTTDLMSKLLDIRATHSPATIWSPSSLFAILINSETFLKPRENKDRTLEIYGDRGTRVCTARDA